MKQTAPAQQPPPVALGTDGLHFFHFISFRFDSISFSSLALTLASLFLSIVLHFYFLFSFFSLQLDLPSRGILLLFLP